MTSADLSRARAIGALVVSALAVAGCGHSSGHSAAPATVTVPAYGVYSQTTVPGSSAPGTFTCRASARTFARDTPIFLGHLRPHGAYPADLYYMILRQHLAEFQAHRCDVKQLGGALSRALTPRQQRTLVAALPNPMAGTVRKVLAGSGS